MDQVSFKKTTSSVLGGQVDRKESGYTLLSEKQHAQSVLTLNDLQEIIILVQTGSIIITQ